jgi:hypothetical protein
MSFHISRTDTPVVAVGTVDDSGFTPGNTAEWATSFRDVLRTARAAGVPLLGRVRMAPNMVMRVIGSEPEEGFTEQVQRIVTFGSDFDGMSLYADQNLATDTVVIE